MWGYSLPWHEVLSAVVAELSIYNIQYIIYSALLPQLLLKIMHSTIPYIYIYIYIYIYMYIYICVYIYVYIYIYE